MNYLRGAVSAISAPYQYYKELPPLNPATLTGAIDVIVVRNPTDDGGHELRCSPFHVRFGKWQVLRPGDKKVNVSVNGRPVPYNMKIGEAGEAFFVFETDAEVPQDLITSPILEATQPGQSNAQVSRQEVQAGRFGAPVSPSEDDSTVPDFDLDASARPSASATPEAEHEKQSATENVLKALNPTSLMADTVTLGKAVAHAAVETNKEEKDRLKDRMEAARNVHQHLREDGLEALYGKHSADKGDEALPDAHPEAVQPSEIVDAGDVVIDRAGYHAPRRESTESTITEHDYASSNPSPEAGPSSTAPQTPETEPDSVPLPFIRATSEPPLDTDESQPHSQPPHRPHHATAASMSNFISSPTRRSPTRVKTSSNMTLRPPGAGEDDEYLWEWGAFPQRSPAKEVFPSIGSGRGIEAVMRSDVNGNVNSDSDNERSRPKRSRSVPREPEFEGVEQRGRVTTPPEVAFGAGGRLLPERNDTTRFRLAIEGRRVWFELSVIPAIASYAGTKGKRNAGKSADQAETGHVLGEWGEVDAAVEFEKGKVNWRRFLDDDGVLQDDGLVIRWAEDKYITRQDGSPLMEALALWRDAARKEESATRSRSLAPLPEEDRATAEFDEPLSSGEDPLSSGDERERSNTPQAASPKASRRTSAWMTRWWSRSQTTDPAATSGERRPELKHAGTTPLETEVRATQSEQVPVPAASPAPSVASAPPMHDGRSLTAPARVPSPSPPSAEETKFVKTLRLSSDQLKALNLRAGPNSITFSLSASGAVACTARIFLWESTDLIVISDIDGTITKSDALGHVFTMIGRDWTHTGVAKLYTDITRNGYKIMYLTSRAIGQADSTRDYLKGVKQNDYQLPEGPVIMSPDRLIASLHREVIMRKPEVFKMACLRDIQRLFGETNRNPFYAGFGNRITDALSYRSVNVPSSRIFTIDSSGEVKMELLELAGYKSSYIHMTDLVDQMFPPVQRKWQAEFTDFNYWKPPIPDIPLPDLSPPSPALSARSDTSNQSTLARLRNLSLMGGRPKSFQLPPPATEAGDAEERALSQRHRHKDAQLRQMSSFERLSQTLGLSSASTVGDSRRSESPVSSSTFLESGSEDEDGEYDSGEDWARKRRKRERRTSMESMPGSLPGSEADYQFGLHEEEEGNLEEGEADVGYGYEGGSDEEDPAEADFDEDLLAAGEMQNVPFL
ncbi:LNS2-domain-containing protein [Punctularia strigosozonata HHB-11173 SS5]|uniref:LNS2-domain-containing protein n=1 Tax=Punctularia strigosozonata (strain HHB-11173) TaxID=741275 RepID=UPI000441649C|nr:LNS2-domain-containing protein [Punctularia strigosozonata HHB-11173 SS5]EIN10997.1 LNS2-domain-containing protein [Punctularia strigosozonata HHB-11173 SS5]